jgi:hypothetical protein
MVTELPPAIPEMRGMSFFSARSARAPKWEKILGPLPRMAAHVVPFSKVVSLVAEPDLEPNLHEAKSKLIPRQRVTKPFIQNSFRRYFISFRASIGHLLIWVLGNFFLEHSVLDWEPEKNSPHAGQITLANGHFLDLYLAAIVPKMN